MQAHELFRYFRMPELVDFQQYVRTLPTNTLMGFGAFAALTTFWYATRPRALKPPCDLAMQSVEVAVSGAGCPRALPLSVFPQDSIKGDEQDHNHRQTWVYLGTSLVKMCSSNRIPAVIRGGGQNVGQGDAAGGAGWVSAHFTRSRGSFSKSRGPSALCWALETWNKGKQA